LMLITHDEHLAARCTRRIHLADGKVTAIDHSPAHVEPVA
jgi:predicted ABC-type transport system involved in lysophospholipase L1 biosynthesis ATPase subunit